LPTTPDSGDGIKARVCNTDDDNDGLCNGWDKNGNLPYFVNGIKYLYPIVPTPAGNSIPDIYYEIDAQQYHAPRGTVTNSGPGTIIDAFDTAGYKLHMVVDETTLTDVLFTNVWLDHDLVRDNDFNNIKADHYGTPSERAHISSAQSSSSTPNTITITNVEILSTPSDSRTTPADVTEGTITLKNIMVTTNAATINSISGAVAGVPSGMTDFAIDSVDWKELASDGTFDAYEITTKIKFVTNGALGVTPIDPVDLTVTFAGTGSISSVSDVAPVTPNITTTLQEARAQIYRYLLYVHDTGGASGHAERLGNDAIISLGNGFGKSVSGHTGSIGWPKEEAGTTMHEIGHNLNLLHGGPYAYTTGAFAGLAIGGDTNTNCKPNYPSVMSYSKQMPYNGLAPNWAAEFSYGMHGPINEGSLTDGSILKATAGTSDVRYIVWGIPTLPSVAVGLSNSVDWDLNAATSGASLDVNDLGIAGCQASPGDPTYNDYDDWDNLNLLFRSTPGGTFDAVYGPGDAEANNVQAIQASIGDATFVTLNPPLCLYGCEVANTQNNVPIKFDLPSASEENESVANLEDIIELWYWSVPPGDDTIPEANEATATKFNECEYTDTHYHCPLDVHLEGRYFVNIMLINPITDEPSENSPLINEKKPNPMKTEGFSFWFDIPDK
jgi:hypothetical protein